MILHVHRFFVFSLVSVLAPTSYAQSTNSSECVQQVCGKESIPYPYPFGFSDGCKIKLNCSRDLPMIGEFVVQNVTSDRIFVNIPGNCNRSIEELHTLYGRNFNPTSRNGFLLENCSAPVSDDCVFLRRSVRSRIGLEECSYRVGIDDHHNISCNLGDSNETANPFLDEQRVRGNGNCSILFSSVMVDLGRNDSSRLNGSSFSVALDFQMVELGWWLEGKCNCDSNAECVPVPVRNGGLHRYRCKCHDGYVGNGFAGREPRCRLVRQSTHVGILIAGVMAGASLVATLAIICYCLRRRTATLKSRLSAKRLISEAAGSSSVPFYPYKDIERATNGFSEKQRLGTGAYGTVYAGKLHNDEWVAIKKIKYRDHESSEQVMNEIKLLSSVSYPNLVRLLGCCIENGEQILVYEFMPNGTLSQHLQRERDSVLPWTTRLTIAAETAHAIAHLHSAMNPPIYHRDIKSSNILLDYNFNSKVADFGLSRFGMTDDSHVSTAPQGTPGYLDPQYHQNFHLSDKSDVYSFGVVLVEIITAMKVVDFSRPHSEINLAALATDRIGKGHIDEIIDPYLEPNRDAWTLSSVHKVAELAFRCLAFHRDMRPSMMEVADELEQIRLSSWAPMDENIHMGSSVASSCSSPYQGSEKSLNVSTSRKAMAGSRRLIVLQKAGATDLPIKEETKDSSPVSVQDPWLSEQSSPSTNSLLGNIAR